MASVLTQVDGDVVADQKHLNRMEAVEEVGFIEMLQELWSCRLQMALTIIAALALAIAYIFLSKPIYASRIFILPPSLSDVAGFNLGRDHDTGLAPFTVQDVYAVFIRKLQAEESRRLFFEKVYLPSLEEGLRNGSRDSLYKRFSDEVSVKIPDKNQPDRYQLQVLHAEPAVAADWARRYIAEANSSAREEVLENTRREIGVKVQGIQQRIKSLREAARVRQMDRIAQLKEALVVAEAVGLERPSNTSSQASILVSGEGIDGSLMYMRGSKALKAEIAALEARASNDPFIPTLRGLEEKYDLYANLLIDPGQVEVSRLDGNFEVPDSPIQPRKSLILVFGVLLGAMAGVLIALLRILLRKWELNTRHA